MRSNVSKFKVIYLIKWEPLESALSMLLQQSHCVLDITKNNKKEERKAVYHLHINVISVTPPSSLYLGDVLSSSSVRHSIAKSGNSWTRGLGQGEEPAICWVGHLACSSANGLVTFQRLTYREDKSHNAAITSRDTLSIQVVDGCVFLSRCLCAISDLPAPVARFVSHRYLGWAGYKATSYFLCPVVQYPVSISLFRFPVWAHCMNGPRELSDQLALSNELILPFSLLFSSIRLSVRAKEGWLLNSIMCHLNKCISLGKTC